MKRITALFSVLMTLCCIQAATQETHEIEIAYYTVQEDAANHAVYYSLYEGNEGKSFNFYIYVEEGKHDIECGKTYTFSGMNPTYCYWQEDAVTAYALTDASFTKTKGEGYAVSFSATAVDTEGERFQLTYTEEPLVLTGDTVSVVFEKPAWIERNSNGTWSVEASNDTIGGKVAYYSTDEQSCAGTFAGDDIYLSACHLDVFTGQYEYGVPVYERIFVKDAAVQTNETDARIEMHAILVGENGVVYDFTMVFVKPHVEENVTILSDSLLIETWGYDRFGTVQVTASDSIYKVIIWFTPAGLDSLIAGTYTVGENECGGWIVNQAAGTESALYSGTFTVIYDDGAYRLDGTVLCKNNVEYTLHLSIAKPMPTREETIVFPRIAMNIYADGWSAYGENADHTKALAITSPSTEVAGTYTEKELTTEMCFVVTDIAPDGSTNQYYTLKEAALTVTFNSTDSVAHITGTMYCFNTQDPNDRPLFTVDVTTAMDGPFFDDATADFTADFTSYAINDLMLEDLGTVLVEARNEADGAFVALQMVVAQGADRLTAGDYPVSLSEAPQTTLASRGMYGIYATYSIAGYANEDNQYSQIWYLVSGTVTVSENGAITVEALNSNNKTVRCHLDRPEGIEAVTPTGTTSGKTLREGLLLIEHNGKTYNAQGICIQ